MSRQYVRTDEHGVMRVGNKRISVDSVLVGFHRGDSPESIQRQYPALMLEEVYGTITYYLSHRKEVDEYLARQDQIWENFRRESDKNPPPVVKRLRKLMGDAVMIQQCQPAIRSMSPY